MFVSVGKGKEKRTPVDDLPTESIGIPAVKRFSWPSSILSSTFFLGSCPLIPFTLAVDGDRMLSSLEVTATAPPAMVCDFFDFFPGACFPILFPVTDRVPIVIREARGWSSSSSSSSSSFSSASLSEEEEETRLFFGGRGGGSLKMDEVGDWGTLSTLWSADNLEDQIARSHFQSWLTWRGTSFR